MGEIPPAPPRVLTIECGPGGRGAEGRGDIIRAAPPPAATSPKARRSIHDIIGLISTHLTPVTPAAGRTPSPAPSPTGQASRCRGHGNSSEPGGAPRWACRTYSLPQGPAQGLPRGRHRPGSLAQPEARPAGRAVRARLAPSPSRSRPGPAHPRLRQTRPRPPATPTRPANPQAGAGRSTLTPSLLHPGRARDLLISPTPGRGESVPTPSARHVTPRPLGSAPSLSSPVNSLGPRPPPHLWQ